MAQTITTYTAEFTITDMATILPLDGLSIDAHDEDAPTVTYITPALTLVLPDATIVSMLKPTLVTLRPSATAPPLSTEQAAPPSSLQKGAAMATLPTLDIERFRFRIVFILWPALVGISMAM
ncbi:hypothetical protein TRAPUB_9987 [Trametes pubescens]|uniref:Uncharacterized protein n=1 Tax=Trametes pubescens TaxID=154538 RepID=A0A1M2W0R4_TRAPU|nr:hypothetical protein TRAPUB_9987 [Trametes pubescens]